MLKEFAVDPAVMASSFETCRYLVDQFGVEKGRLLSQFPKKWKRAVYDAAEALPDGRRKEKVFNYIEGLGSRGLVLVASNREYPNPNAAWLENAMAAHSVQPFSGIICDREDASGQLIDADHCDSSNPLFAAASTSTVRRTASELAGTAHLLLQNCRQLRLVDPHFNPHRPKWRNPLAAFLGAIPNIEIVHCEYHILNGKRSPPFEELKSGLKRLAGVIPPGGQLRVVRWKEVDDGEWFHKRYVLTENAGLRYEGLDEAAEPGQTTDVSVLDHEHHKLRWSQYDASSSAYGLSDPILIVDSSGEVREEDVV